MPTRSTHCAPPPCPPLTHTAAPPLPPAHSHCSPTPCPPLTHTAAPPPAPRSLTLQPPPCPLHTHTPHYAHTRPPARPPARKTHTPLWPLDPEVMTHTHCLTLNYKAMQTHTLLLLSRPYPHPQLLSHSDPHPVAVVAPPPAPLLTLDVVPGIG